MFSRLMAKWRRGRSAKAERPLLDAVCQPLEGRVLLAHTIYVDVNSPATKPNGTSWGSAYVELQRALGTAVSGDTIRVADGTYTPTGGEYRTDSFRMKTGVGIYGGYAGYGAKNPDLRSVAGYPSILSAGNCYRAVVGSGTTATAILDGFTISGGHADQYGGSLGGGLYIEWGKPTIRNCTFTGNTAEYGGGVYAESSAPTLIHCTFSANTADDGNGSAEGGGMYNSASSPTLTDCTFSGNTANVGGGIYNRSSSPKLSNCRFSGNWADAGSTESGGGMYNEESSPTLTNCTFSMNLAGLYGGAMFNEASSPKLTNCTFSGNSADDGGGICNNTYESLAPSSPTLINCAFIGNIAGGDGSGGGIRNNAASSPSLINCTLSGNTAAHGGAMSNDSSSPTLINCILWGNKAAVGPQIDEVDGRTSVTYSDIQGGWVGKGNIHVDPLFVIAPGPGGDGALGTDGEILGDLRLRACSPAVDAGDSDAAGLSGIAKDLRGGARFVDVPTTADTGAGDGPIVDMGAYETTAVLDAEAGGPYRVSAGGRITLSGLGASNHAGALSYAWDLDGDGAYDDAVGRQVVFSSAGIHAPATVKIALQVKDSMGRKRTDSSTVKVVATVLYVDDSASGSNDGSSWANAFRSLQSALKGAIAGDEIRVGQGTYVPTTGTDPEISFRLRNGVKVYGGYAGYGASNPDARDIALCQTILSGDIGGIGDIGDNSYHVVVGSGTNATAVLDGVTITGGRADANAVLPNDRYGGGMFNLTGSPTVANCTFSGNSAYDAAYNLGGKGGGMFNGSSSSPSLTRCAFSGNSAGCGGGIYNDSSSPTLTNCTFSQNSGDSGSGMYNASASNPTLKSCTFSGNTAGGHGGGVYNDASSPKLSKCTFIGNSASGVGGGIYNDSSSPTLTNCTFSGNSSHTGGGIYNLSSSPDISNCMFTRNQGEGGAVHNCSSSPRLTNCTFNGNSASDGDGGAIYNKFSSKPKLTNCTFSGNSSRFAGGGMYNDSSSPDMTNCTFSGNSAGNFGGGIYSTNSSSPSLTNCVIWGNAAETGSQLEQSRSRSIITYSDIQGGWAGKGNINTDPLFVRLPSDGADGKWGTTDDDYGDLRLQVFSPAADAGNNAASGLSGIHTDLGGGRRFQDMPTTHDKGAGTAPIVDMGAHEAAAALTADPCGPYIAIRGRDLQLRGRGASNKAGPLTYAWEWTGDGKFDDGRGSNPVFPASSGALPSIVRVSLRVTDAASHSVISTSTVTILLPVVFVDGSVVGGSGDGTSWANAFTSLATALGQAVAGQEIHVAGGTYTPTDMMNSYVSFQLKSGVAVLGGYAGAADPTARDIAAYPTILSGDIGAIGNNRVNSRHVVVGSGTNHTAVLDGFTITAGNADPGDYYPSDGGGMYNLSGSPTLNNCSFIGNKASSGGGMANVSSAPTLTNCLFSGNSAASGGGMANDSSAPTLINCSFAGNTGGFGGGIRNVSSTPTLTNCSFTGNTTDNSGGGMENYYSNATLIDCSFRGNTASDHGYAYGGGICNRFSGPTLVNCSFSGNAADGYGGGMYNRSSSPTLTNCTFSGHASASGGAMYNRRYRSSYEDQVSYGDYSNPTLTNCILWGNGNSPIASSDNGPDAFPVIHSDIEGGWTGDGNINADPVFIRNPASGADGKWGTTDDDYGDLRLQDTSPCIDVGSTSAVPTDITVDMAGNPRLADAADVAGANVDMGAYEFAGAAFPALSVNDAAVAEGNSGTTKLVFTVTLSAASSDAVSVQYATADDTATANSDYLAASGTIRFDPGQTSKTIQVLVKGDRILEPSMRLSVKLTSPVNALIARAQGTGKIVDDDAPEVPGIAVATVSPAATIKSAQAAVMQFGVVDVGAAGPQKEFQVTNTGTASLILGKVSVPDGYQLVDGLVGTLAPGKSDVFAIKLVTRKAGKYGGVVSFGTNTAGNMFRFSISGTVK